MTEREYIDATNLARIRAAMAVLRDFLQFERPQIDKSYADAMRALSDCQDNLAKIVKCEG